MQQRWVEFSTSEEAEKATSTLDKTKLDDREIMVKAFEKRTDKFPSTRGRSRLRSPSGRKQHYVGNVQIGRAHV